MNLGDYNMHRGWDMPNNEDPNKEGYLIESDNGTITWCPALEFEQSHLPLADAEGKSIKEEDVDNFTFTDKILK